MLKNGTFVAIGKNMHLAMAPKRPFGLLFSCRLWNTAFAYVVCESELRGDMSAILGQASILLPYDCTWCAEPTPFQYSRCGARSDGEISPTHLPRWICSLMYLFYFAPMPPAPPLVGLPIVQTPPPDGPKLLLRLWSRQWCSTFPPQSLRVAIGLPASQS